MYNKNVLRTCTSRTLLAYLHTCIILYIFQACPFDHYGENCTFTCDTPQEGFRCSTGGCHCNRVSCNVSITSPRCFTSKCEFLSILPETLEGKSIKNEKFWRIFFLLRKTTFEGKYLLYDNNYMIRAFLVHLS